MESDSDNFESADENLSSDDEESSNDQKNHVKIEENDDNKRQDGMKDTKNINFEEKNIKNNESEEEKHSTERKKHQKIDTNTQNTDKSEPKHEKRAPSEEKCDKNTILEKKNDEKIENRSQEIEKSSPKDAKRVSFEEKCDKNTFSDDENRFTSEQNDVRDENLIGSVEKSVSEPLKSLSLEEKCDEPKSVDQNTQENVTVPLNASVKTEIVAKSELLDSKVDNPESLDSKPIVTPEISENVRKKQPPERPERKERPTKMKSKLGVKLGTKIDKKPPVEENIRPEKPDPEPCWEDETGWDAFDAPTEKYSIQKSDAENFWNNEEQYMEIPKQKEGFQGIADKLSAGDRQQSSGWSSWGNWGVSSILSTASLGVSTLTNSVSQGITTVLETGIGIPDPEELARQDTQNKQKRNSTSTEHQSKVSEDFSKSNERSSMNLGLGLGNLVSGVTHITKLVETTGTKVLSGGLDTLEVIGKKTMEVLQEGDPGFKKKKAFLGIDHDKPVLSHVLREAKEKAEEENKFLQERHFETKAHYETLFDDHQGLVHLEALEMLSKQCDIKLETLLESLTGNELTEFQETLAQIKELCEIPEDDEDPETDIQIIEEKLSSAVVELNVKISHDNLIKTWTEIEDWLNDACFSEKEIHQKSIEVLAKLTAVSVEQFHKAGELLLVKERRSTVDEADSLVQLTTTLTSLIGMTANKFSERLNALAEFANDPDCVNSLITNIFFEAANSSSYIQDAFHLLIPVLQVGAV